MFTDCLHGVPHRRATERRIKSRQKAWIRDLKAYRIILFEMLKDKGVNHGW